MHEKKIKGDIGVGYAIAILTEQLWNVCLPLTEHAPYDLIAEKDGLCKRVQVRYCTPNGGVMIIKLKSSWSDKHGNHVKKRVKGDFDTICGFNPENKTCYFLSDEDFENGNSINIRMEKPKNNQLKGIRLAEDFKIMHP
jgi:hypothetical protein